MPQGSSRSLQDFSLIRTHVDRVTTEVGLADASLGFYFFALETLLGLQQDEAEDAITDNAYLCNVGARGGHDRGIDAVYIDEAESPATVHFFNMKYVKDFKKTDRHFPGGEIDKICGFLSGLIQQDEHLVETVNEVLRQKVNEVWDLFDKQNPKFVIHLCANIYLPFEQKEKERFELEIAKFSNFEIIYHLMPGLVDRITRKGKQKVDAQIRAIDRNHFEKSDGDIRALIVDVDTRDLLRIVIDDNEVRQDVDSDDYSIVADTEILEDAFEDNVRVYLRQRSKINRNIKETAVSDDSHRFFYFNNGITITCSRFSYPKQRRNPIIHLENLQIVNGSQTIHALHEAFKESPGQFENMDILCRIYETESDQLTTDIAEYTNSQNPVKSRDIRSNDYTQKKLDSEMLALGYFYERKKNQYSGKPREKRIDAEKAGQALMAFFNKLPAEAKNEKRLIFAEKYEDVFSDEITADGVLVAMALYQVIEAKKLERKAEILAEPEMYEHESFILHATYYLLYTIAELADNRGIPKEHAEMPRLKALYDDAARLIRTAMDEEKRKLESYAENYSHRLFFKSNRPKKHVEESVRGRETKSNKKLQRTERHRR